MLIDVSPAVSALADAGVAVAAVGASVLLVVVGVRCYRFLNGLLGDAQRYRAVRDDAAATASYERWVAGGRK